jgi:hypothetical protein
LPKHSRPFAFNVCYVLIKVANGKIKLAFLGPPNKCRAKQIWVAKSESCLRGVNRRNLKIINSEHALHLGLGLGINNIEFRAWKIVLFAMSCSINADNFGSQLKTI